MDIKELFESVTGLKLKKDTDYYDDEYGYYRYEIQSSSLLMVLDKVLKFNLKYGRVVKPTIIGNKIFVFL